MNIKEITETIIRGEPALKFPLHYSDYGQKILDANGVMVADMRGWGRLQYHTDGEEAAAKLQDAIGEWIVETLNDGARGEGLLCSYENCNEPTSGNSPSGFYCDKHIDFINKQCEE